MGHASVKRSLLSSSDLEARLLAHVLGGGKVVLTANLESRAAAPLGRTESRDAPLGSCRLWEVPTCNKVAAQGREGSLTGFTARSIDVILNELRTLATRLY